MLVVLVLQSKILMVLLITMTLNKEFALNVIVIMLDAKLVMSFILI